MSHTLSQSGQYTGDVGDLMVLTVANILHVPTTIFTLVPNMPVICVMPTSQSVILTQPLFVAFTQSGPGHYDAFIREERASSKSKTPTTCHKTM